MSGVVQQGEAGVDAAHEVARGGVARGVGRRSAGGRCGGLVPIVQLVHGGVREPEQVRLDAVLVLPVALAFVPGSGAFV